MRESAARGSRSDGTRPVVAHVNYLFFHSTQSFLYSYLASFRRVEAICLTRTAESSRIRSELPPALAGNYYLYGQREDGSEPLLRRLIWPLGVGLRRTLGRLPPRLGDRLLEQMQRNVVTRVRPEARAARFLPWAEGIFAERRVQLIHAAFGPVGWRMLELKRKLGLPLVVTFLGDETAPELNPWWWWWIQRGREQPCWPERLRELFAGGDLFLAEGPYLRERMIELGCPPEKVRVQRIAVPVRSRTRPDPPPKRPGERKILLYAGRMCEQKGLLYALEAVRLLRRSRHDFELRIIGDDTLTDGRYAARVRAAIREGELDDCVRLLGFMNHADYLAELSRADLFVHPSIVTDAGVSEGGAPTTILDAQAYGIPVVSTTHCDIPNVTVPGRSALLVPERDATALAKVLELLLDHPENWREMGDAGRRHVERFHDIEHEARALEELYFELLDRSPAAAFPRP